MEKKYCSYELSKLAKDAGFDEECFGVYKKNQIHELEYPYSNTEFISEYKQSWISAPELTHLQQQVYENFQVWISANQEPQNRKNIISNHVDFNYSIKKNGADVTFDTTSFDCPYKALESGLLEFFKNKKNAKQNNPRKYKNRQF